jgi:hypothetical protein
MVYEQLLNGVLDCAMEKISQLWYMLAVKSP